jgi:hypothetical protein
MKNTNVKLLPLNSHHPTRFILLRHHQSFQQILLFQFIIPLLNNIMFSINLICLQHHQMVFIQFNSKLTKSNPTLNLNFLSFRNYYPPPMNVRYPPAGIHHYPSYAPAPQVHHQPPPPPIVPTQHIPTNGYNMPNFPPHPTAPFTSTSTFITHRTATQPISTALSENEFYTKQRYFQKL